MGRGAATPDSRHATGAIATGVPTAERASRTPETGPVLPPISKDINLDQMFVFSCGVPNIHTDRTIALESGLAGPIAQGLMSTGYLSQLLTDFFGTDWFGSGWTSHAFIKPVFAGDRLTVHARIQDSRQEGNGTRLMLEVWCRNQVGDFTTVGSASALVCR